MENRKGLFFVIHILFCLREAISLKIKQNFSLSVKMLSLGKYHKCRCEKTTVFFSVFLSELSDKTEVMSRKEFEQTPRYLIPRNSIDWYQVAPNGLNFKEVLHRKLFVLFIPPSALWRFSRRRLTSPPDGTLSIHSQQNNYARSSHSRMIGILKSLLEHLQRFYINFFYTLHFIRLIFILRTIWFFSPFYHASDIWE